MGLNINHWRQRGRSSFRPLFRGRFSTPWRLTPGRAAALATLVALIVALMLGLMPNVAAAQPAPASPAAPAPSRAPEPDRSAPERTREGARDIRKQAGEAKDTAKDTAGDWGDKIKETSQRLIGTTKEVFGKLAEKIPGTDAHSRAKSSSGNNTSNDSSQRAGTNANSPATARP